jgi:hypothetical protein
MTEPHKTTIAMALDTAPKNTTMIWLLVDYSGEGCNPLEDETQGWTIGFNSLDDTGIDEWQFAGWNWQQDIFTEGRGKVIGWYPLHWPDISAAARDVLAERQRQISAEGWTPEHDDEHDCCELALVAALYASPVPLFEESREEGISTTFSDPWPESWDDAWDRREDFDERRKLVIAGALILAEIERIDRVCPMREEGA